MRKLIIYIFVLFFGFANAQELNCVVEINSDQVGATNKQIFITLQKSLTEFINNTKWSQQVYKQNEKIECSFFFTITTYNVDQFSGTLQIQASRPVFNGTYMSPILNVNDKDINFTYTEFQNLFFDINSYDSNLISIIAYYANVIVGIDGDTFSPDGGSKSLENAQNIVNIAQQGQQKGWSATDGNQNRFFLINDMLSSSFTSFRKAMYEYHFKAMDKMSDNPKEAKENIKLSLKTLQEITNIRPNAYITRVFFDAKMEEILSIFSGGPKIEIADVVENLNRMSPTNAAKWGQISY